MIDLLSTLLLMAGLTSSEAREPAVDSTAEGGRVTAAVQLLSRFGPGELPPTGPVLGAIATLQSDGDADCAPLLVSLQEHEKPGIAMASAHALAAVQSRDLEARRSAFVASLPQRDGVEAWLESRADDLAAAAGESLGPAEQEALGYSVLVLGEADGSPISMELLAPESSALTVAQGDAAQERGRFADAVALYGQAAASGSAQAALRLHELDIDAELLLLGMTTGVSPGPAWALPANAIEVLLPSHGRTTVAVLIERARRRAPMSRVVAIDALSELASRGALTARERASARRSMELATADPRPAIRAVAATALLETETSER